MGYKSKEDPWIKTETDHFWQEADQHTHWRCGWKQWSCPLPWFRVGKETTKQHSQKWLIDEDEKSSRWAANKKALKLKDEREKLKLFDNENAVTYGAPGSSNEAV